MLKRLTLISLVVVLAAATYVSAQPSHGPGSDRPTAARKAPALKITGHVNGLYPGRAKRIRLRIKNRSNSPLVVRSIKAKVKKKPRAGCKKKNLRLKRRRMRTRVPARRTRRTRLNVKMITDAADACQGAKFKLRYRAKVHGR